MDGSRVDSRMPEELDMMREEGGRKTLQTWSHTGATIPLRTYSRPDPALGTEQNTKLPGHGAHVLEKGGAREKYKRSKIYSISDRDRCNEKKARNKNK